ncbi:uncharacterized protein BT62DRAFT_938065 [Guyanagaster necrorhizus]|uniref:SET domain-containing protein n=1 Tax=Guyanagaster necrorhizus TaxID=856835 RepID=A0A9P8AN04_9AGAR|nr:uncharacterized protein BT62DRAFT_938065 [Guyanagaster necrorhizus MCA 3950]KAG7440392.1 hypothetical protein BT62DRAFT_938065 [Guyanagaster necrorhizus MCA 3950]
MHDYDYSRSSSSSAISKNGNGTTITSHHSSPRASSSSPRVSASTTTKQIFSPDDPTLRCICELPHDDGFGFSIGCEDCLRWCHAACFGIYAGVNEPDEWRCWVCKGEGGSRCRGDEVDEEEERQTYVRIEQDILRLHSPNHSPTPHSSPPAAPDPHLTYLLHLPSPPDSVLPPTYTLHTAQHVSPGTFLISYLSVVTSARSYVEDPLNGYAYARVPRVFVHLIPSHDHSDDCGVALDARLAGNAARWIRSGCYPNAEIHASEDGGWGVYAMQELSAGDEIVLGWEWDDAHPIHGGEEGKVEAVDALEGAFMTCACDGRMGCALEAMRRGDWKAGNLGPLVGKQRGFKTRARERGGVEIVPGKGKQKQKELREVSLAEKRTGQEGVVPPKMRKGQARKPTSPSPLSPTDAFAKLSLTSPVFRGDDSTTLSSAHDSLPTLSVPALSRRRPKSPGLTSDMLGAETFESMSVDSPPTVRSSSNTPMSDGPVRPPLPKRRSRKQSQSPSLVQIDDSPQPQRVDNGRSVLAEAPRRPSLPKRQPRAKESPDSTPDTPPLETPEGMTVDLPLPTPNIPVVEPTVMSPGKKRKEPDTEPLARLTSPSPVMRTPSPDIPGLFLVSPKTPPSHNSPASFPLPASPTVRSQLFSSHSPPSPPSPPPIVSKSLSPMKSEPNPSSPQKRRKMTLDDWKKEREKKKVGERDGPTPVVIKQEEEEPSLRTMSTPIPIPVPRAPRAMTIPGAPRAPRAMMGGWGC